MAVTMAAVKSAIGMLTQTPNVPQIGGRIIKQGTKKINWRVNERKIALRDKPMDRKKFEATIWKPTIGKTANTMCNPKTDSRISSSSLVKKPTIVSGKRWQIKNPVVDSPTAHQVVSRVTSSTRGNNRAP